MIIFCEHCLDSGEVKITYWIIDKYGNHLEIESIKKCPKCCDQNEDDEKSVA